MISGPLRCTIASLGCVETFHLHLKKLFNGRVCYHLFIKSHFFSPCLLESLSCNHFINFPIHGTSSYILYLSLLYNAWSADSLLVPGQIQLSYESINLLGQEASLSFPGLLNEGKRTLIILALEPFVTAWICSITFTLSFLPFLV